MTPPSDEIKETGFVIDPDFALSECCGEPIVASGVMRAGATVAWGPCRCIKCGRFVSKEITRE